MTQFVEVKQSEWKRLPRKRSSKPKEDSGKPSTCVSIYRQCWFCMFSARCALAVSAEALPVFSPSFHFSAFCGHFLSGALELMSALFSF